MKLSPKTQVEVFHLLFLRQFSSLTDPSLYAIKGGCNLRFFFDSVRYSEDLDMDVTTIQKQTLENKVSKILHSPALIKSLMEYGITEINSSAPKQTSTTQRWKIQLHTAERLPFNTKIECSRRNTKLNSEPGNITTNICQTYRLAPMRLTHYGANEAIQQKITALANRTETQARDVFDLYHLLHITPHTSVSVSKTIKEKTIEALLSLHFNEYKSQVVNFLEPIKQAEFDHKEYWENMITTVKNFI